MQCLHINSRSNNVDIYREQRTVAAHECSNLPLTLQIEVTRACNLNCCMCYYHHDSTFGHHMSDRILEIAYELGEYSRLVYPFGAGESLLYPDLSEVIKRFKDMGNSVAIITNGMLLHEERVDQMLSAGLDSIAISFDAAEKRLFEKIRVGSDFDRVCGNIRMLEKAKNRMALTDPELALSVIVQRRNFHQLPGIVDLAAGMNLACVHVNPLVPHEHIPGLNDEGIAEAFPRWQSVLDLCRRKAKEAGIRLNMERVEFMLRGDDPEMVYRDAPICPEPFHFLLIDVNGDVFPCCNWDPHRPFGNIAREEFNDVWFGPLFENLRKNLAENHFDAACETCMRRFSRPLEDTDLG